MTTITLPPEIEKLLIEEAQTQGTTPELLALDYLRQLFGQQATAETTLCSISLLVTPVPLAAVASRFQKIAENFLPKARSRSKSEGTDDARGHRSSGRVNQQKRSESQQVSRRNKAVTRSAPSDHVAMFYRGDVSRLSRWGTATQVELWRRRTADRLALHEPIGAEIDRMASLMATYEDRPMDLADASLVAAAERLGARQIFTLDTDFYIYRLADGSALEPVP